MVARGSRGGEAPCTSEAISHRLGEGCKPSSRLRGAVREPPSCTPSARTPPNTATALTVLCLRVNGHRLIAARKSRASRGAAPAGGERGVSPRSPLLRGWGRSSAKRCAAGGRRRSLDALSDVRTHFHSCSHASLNAPATFSASMVRRFSCHAPTLGGTIQVTVSPQ
jgi:hypothetical protein